MIDFNILGRIGVQDMPKNFIGTQRAVFCDIEKCLIVLCPDCAA